MKLLIFDFDGTLADTSRAILLTIARTLEELGQKAPPGTDFTRYIGLPLTTIFELALGTGDKKRAAGAVRIYRELFPANAKASVRLFPGVEETLRELADAGMTLAIASSRGRASLLALAESLGITPLFAHIVGEEDVAKPKPAPDLAELVAARAAIPARSAMFIGDTVFDIACGRAAGMRTCGVAYGNHTGAQLLGAGADHVIDIFPALLDVIGKRRSP